MRYPLSWLPACLLLLAAAPARAADDTYAIKLSRPSKVGDLVDIDLTVELTRTTTITLPGQNPQVRTQTTKGVLQGREETLQVDKKGNDLALVLTIKKLADGQGNQLLKPGQEIKIKREAKSVTFEIVGGDAMPSDAKTLLDGIYSPHTPDSPTDDEAFGSPDKHKIGDTWPIDAERASKGATSAGLDIDPKQITGTTTLKSLDTIGGVAALRVSCTLVVKDATPASPDPSLNVESFNMQSELTGAFPLDPTLQPLESTEKGDGELHMTSPANGATVVVKSVMSRSVKTTTIKK